MKKNIYIIIFSLFLLCFYNLSLFSNDSLHKKKLSSLSYIDFNIGVNLNQGSVGSLNYAPNLSPAYRINLNLISYKYLDIIASTNYFTKSYKGDYTNDTQFNNYGFGSNSAPPFYTKPPPIDFKIKYCSFDIKAKFNFFYKRKLQPYISTSIRVNFLLDSKYYTDERDVYVDYFILPNLKKNYFNYTIGFGIFYKLNKKSGLLFEVDSNNDVSYFTNWKYGGAIGRDKSEQQYYGGKFICLFAHVGYRYTFNYK